MVQFLNHFMFRLFTILGLSRIARGLRLVTDSTSQRITARQAISGLFSSNLWTIPVGTLAVAAASRDAIANLLSK